MGDPDGNNPLPDALKTALKKVRSAGVITGAGVSRESGIRTYRGKGGVYDDPEKGERLVEALTGSTLARDPDRTWRAVAAMAREALGARPNPAHAAIVEMERRLEPETGPDPACFTLLTQNVDGLHRAAGSRNVIAIHGSLHHAICLHCGRRTRIEPDRLATLEQAPRCGSCLGVMRPDAVLFEELLPPEQVARMQAAFLDRVPDLLLLAGTTALFPYIQDPLLRARRLGRLTVEVNVEPTVMSGLVDYFLQGPAGAILPHIAAALPERVERA